VIDLPPLLRVRAGISVAVWCPVQVNDVNTTSPVRVNGHVLITNNYFENIPVEFHDCAVVVGGFMVCACVNRRAATQWTRAIHHLRLCCAGGHKHHVQLNPRECKHRCCKRRVCMAYGHVSIHVRACVFRASSAHVLMLQASRLAGAGAVMRRRTRMTTTLSATG
jgi:hypothetical protein